MRLSLFILLFTILFTACSSDDESLSLDFPATFMFDEASSTGMRTYFFTDTIIYRVDNLQDLDSLSLLLDSSVMETILQEGANKDEFIIQTITFESETMASVSYYTQGSSTLTTQSTPYILEQNIGSINQPFLFNFKVNEDLSRLISCYSHIATRNVDTLFLGIDQLLPTLDTLQEDGVSFQLIPTDGDFIEGYCNPTNESIEIELYSNEQGLQNDDRIIIHRMDLIFQPN